MAKYIPHLCLVFGQALLIVCLIHISWIHFTNAEFYSYYADTKLADGFGTGKIFTENILTVFINKMLMRALLYTLYAENLLKLKTIIKCRKIKKL